MKRAIVILMLLAACSKEETPIEASKPAPSAPPPPTAPAARDLIANAAEFGEYEFTNAGYTTPVSAAMMNEPARVTAKELAADGWLALDGTGDIALTDKSRNDKRFLLRPNGLLDIVPLAKKEMGEVQNVTANPDGTAFVDFTWRWLPNEVGQSFKTGLVHERFAAQQDGRATLMWDGATWSVLKIE